MRSPAKCLAVVLFIGTALLGVGAVMHPVLPDTPLGRLQVMAATPLWKTIHLIMLSGSGLVILGIWARLIADSSAPTTTLRALGAALTIIAIGEALNALDVAFMAGAGHHMAGVLRSGDMSIVPIFAATHEIGLMFARYGNWVVALGAVLLGWAEWSDANQPRWLAWLAWLAALGGFIGISLVEGSRLNLAAVALLSAWQVATAIRTFRSAR